MSDTSPFILSSPDSTLPNARTLVASGGIVLNDTGAGGTLTVTTVGNLNNLSSYSQPGFLVYDNETTTITSRSITAGTGIAIVAGGGQGFNTQISVVPSTTVQLVNVLANGVQIATQPTLNFISSGSISITVGNNGLDTRADITISAPVAADVNAKYIIQTPDGGLPNAQALSPLSTGLMKVTTGTGVVSTAVANTDYLAPSANLTSISAITPTEGSLIVGNGTGYEGFPSGGDPGDVLTSSGVGSLPSWQAPASGNLTVILPDPTLTQTLVGNTTYIAHNNSGSQTVFTLPAVANAVPGQFYQIIGIGGIGWRVSQNASQSIDIGHSNTTTGTSGYIQSASIGGMTNSSVIIYCLNSTTFIANIENGFVLIN